MKINARLFFVLAAFFVLADAAYVIWTVIYNSQQFATDPSGAEASNIEWVGTTGLLLAAVFASFLGFYFNTTAHAQGGTLPEDRNEANIEDGDAEQGHFSPNSWWPITLALAAALVFLGLAVGVWIAFGGVALFIVAIIGLVYEYYRGYFAH